jgi:hypothetical protein
MRSTDADRSNRRFESAVSQMREMCLPYNSQANELLDEGLSRPKQDGSKPPDNFVRADLAEVVQSRYPRIAGLIGLKGEIKGLNRGIYAALSRERHRTTPKQLMAQRTQRLYGLSMLLDVTP